MAVQLKSVVGGVGGGGEEAAAAPVVMRRVTTAVDKTMEGLIFNRTGLTETPKQEDENHILIIIA